MVVPNIPETAHNCLDLIVQGIRASELRYDLSKQSPLTQAKYDNMFLELKRIGVIAEVQGPVIYNPFGGVDVTGFLLHDDITDVFSHGKECIGSPINIKSYLTDNDTDVEFNNWDSTLTLSRINVNSGVGGLLIDRIIYLLGGKVTGVYYFDIDEHGKVIFYSKQLSEKDDKRDDKRDDQREYDNAVINFEHNGTEKRFWFASVYYSLDEFDHSEERYFKFVDTLDFNTLLIKGALNLGHDFILQDVLRTIIIPTKRCRARILSDCELPPNGSPRSIWKADGFRTERLEHGFGYGNLVYYGDYSGLEDANDFH